MDRKKIALICLLLLLVSSVNAATITFIDSAYLKNGTLEIYLANDTQITRLNSTEITAFGNTSAYMVEYHSGNLFDSSEELKEGFNLPLLYFLLSYFGDPLHWINLLITILCLIIFWMGLVGYL